MSTSGQNNPTRKGKGRQKVNLTMIANENNRQVTFSKRRAGLFKKASELSTLCGAQAAIVIFSPGNKAYSFGHPNVDAVANRFLGEIGPPSHSDHLIEAHRNANIKQQILELNQVERQLELERKCGKELDEQRMAGEMQLLNGLDIQQLGKLKKALLDFRNNLGTKTQNPPSFDAQRVPRTNPNLERGETFQWPRPMAASFSVPFDSNVIAPTHFMGYTTKGNMSKGKAPMAPNESSGPFLFDGGASSHNSFLKPAPRAQNLEIRGSHEAMASDPNFTIPYDPMAGSSDIIIPYSDDPSTPMTDPQNESNFSNFIPYGTEKNSFNSLDPHPKQP